MSSRATPRIHQRGLLLALGSLLALVLVEISLQAAAWVYRMGLSPATGVGENHPGDDSYRVLCLGESTTAPYFGVIAYDRILERLLEERDFGVRFRLINAGYAAHHTSLLLEKLPGLLEEHDPDMVIIMMGINDHLYFDEPDRHALPMDLQLWLLRSRSYRLLRILGQRLGAGRAIQAQSPVDREHLDRFQARKRKLLASRHEHGATPEVEQEMLALIRMAQEASPEPAPGGSLVDVPEPYLDFYQKLHEWLSDIYRKSEREDMAIGLLHGAIERHPEVEYFHRKLAGTYEELGRRELADDSLRRAGELAERHVLSITRANYQTMTSLLRSRGIQIVAMQYPLRKLVTLRYLLDDADDVTFVDNEAIFRAAVDREGYYALFRGRFAGDFGHCTARGNELIAQNLLDSVFEPLFAR